jgi:hypothetical protein
MKTRSLATLAIVLLSLVAGVALLYVARPQEPPTRVFALRSSPTPTATAAIATTTPPVATASNLVNVCGPLNAYQAATGKDGKPQDIILSLKTSAGFVDYRLVLNGTIPADLGRDNALPEILRLTGRRVEGLNAVADYNVARVSSCSALP